MSRQDWSQKSKLASKKYLSDFLNVKLIASRFVFLYFGPLQISSKLGTVRQLIKQRESNYIFHKSFQCSLELQLLKTNGLRSLHLVTQYAFNVLLTLILWQIVHYMKANTSHASNDQSCLDIKVGSCSSYWAKSKCFHKVEITDCFDCFEGGKGSDVWWDDEACHVIVNIDKPACSSQIQYLSKSTKIITNSETAMLSNKTPNDSKLS